MQTDGKLCSSGEGGTDGKDLPVRTCMCGSAHDCGCVWSMAVIPWQPHEYYYYSRGCHSTTAIDHILTFYSVTAITSINYSHTGAVHMVQ